MRRYMRKGVALLLAVLVLGVAACGTPDEKQPQQDNVAGEQTPGDSANPGRMRLITRMLPEIKAMLQKAEISPVQ